MNRLDEPVFMAGQKPMQTEFGIHLRLESCEPNKFEARQFSSEGVVVKKWRERLKTLC